jgi:hypothetical protein
MQTVTTVSTRGGTVANAPSALRAASRGGLKRAEGREVAATAMKCWRLASSGAQ